jgi:hypothetical protein
MTLEEYNSLYDSLIKTKITESNLLEFHNFTRFSPEKFARKLGIDELEFTKKCNDNKKEIHNKILGWKRIKKLKGYKPIAKQEIRQRWDRKSGENTKVTYNFLVCICKKYCKLDYTYGSRKYRFYEDIKYLYCWDPIYYGMIMVLNDKNEEFRIGVDEFNKHFDDYRDKIINDLLS